VKAPKLNSSHFEDHIAGGFLEAVAAVEAVLGLSGLLRARKSLGALVLLDESNTPTFWG